MSQQKDGCYPRVTGTMLKDPSMDVNGMLVSVVGRVLAGGGGGNGAAAGSGLVEFQTADQSVIQLQTENYAGEVPLEEIDPGMVVEIIGQSLDGGRVLAFVAREMSRDMDLDIYLQMLKLQQLPQYGAYFGMAR